ncbi:MAG: SAM-dependent chlorinase/fluorinase [Candidatus Aminicenantes bacterium]|nr:SAM-dependent chlorinase/fluorinase [Candidatus Aminicenantes bacterium]
MNTSSPVIVLLTDFGQKDYFVASMKGVILDINPHASIVDLSHEVSSYDILQAGFMLYASYAYFPQGTIFVSVVDPGVGSSRRILLAGAAGRYFIAPDNGLLSLVFNKENYVFLREIKNPKFFLSKVSITFEARDKMASSAAWLSSGRSPEEFGPEVSECVSLNIPHPKIEKGRLLGTVLYKDKFGNLITNIPVSFLKDYAAKQGGLEQLVLQRGERKILWADRYSNRRIGEELFLAGSLGLIEIAVCEGSAAEKLKMEPGDSVTIRPVNSDNRKH